MDKEGRQALEDIGNLIGIDYEILFDQYLFIPPSKPNQEVVNEGCLISRQGEVLDIKVNSVHALIISIPSKTEIVGYVVLGNDTAKIKKDLSKKVIDTTQLIKSNNELDISNEGFSLFNTLEMMKPKLKVLVIRGDGSFGDGELYLVNQHLTVSYNNITFPYVEPTGEFTSHRYVKRRDKWELWE